MRSREVTLKKSLEVKRSIMMICDASFFYQLRNAIHISVGDPSEPKFLAKLEQREGAQRWPHAVTWGTQAGTPCMSYSSSRVLHYWALFTCLYLYVTILVWLDNTQV